MILNTINKFAKSVDKVFGELTFAQFALMDVVTQLNAVILVEHSSVGVDDAVGSQ